MQIEKTRDEHKFSPIVPHRPCWTPFITPSKISTPPKTYTLGVLPGEGIGPEIVGATLKVLKAISDIRPIEFDLIYGGAIGLDAITETGRPLSESVIRLCEDVFARNGAIFAGPGGDRFVYDMRRHFNLFCKLNPLVPNPVIRNCGVIKPQLLSDIDILVVRDNSGGIYQGKWSELRTADGTRKCVQEFAYEESQVERLVRVAAAIAQQRRGKLTTVLKPNGVPMISQLWADCATKIAREFRVTLDILEIDNAVYQLIQSPASFDVIVTPNLFGDIVADLGGVLLGSRGLCYGASFSEMGAAVYQTNHGAAHDLAGTDRANPVAQIYTLALLLRESFGLHEAADFIHEAVTRVWQCGIRTHDLAEPGCRCVGTQEMGELIADSIREIA